MAKKVISTIRGQVYELLKDSICAGEFEPGQWLQEKELAEQYNVSRSPIREALRQLASDGLVIDVPNKGVFVRKFTPKDMEEIFDLRVILESYAIGKVCALENDDYHAELKACLSALENAYNENNHELYVEQDRALHNTIIRLSGNSLLVSAYERVQIMFQQFRAYSLTDKVRFDDSITEHRELVHSLLSHSHDEAIEINNNHLILAKEQIVRYLQSQNTH